MVSIPSAVLRQAVFTLVQMAIDASPAGGVVTVSGITDAVTFTLRVHHSGGSRSREDVATDFEGFAARSPADAGGHAVLRGVSSIERTVDVAGGALEVTEPPEGGTEIIVRIPLASESLSGVAQV